jgi:hypothetical protein
LRLTVVGCIAGVHQRTARCGPLQVVGVIKHPSHPAAQRLAAAKCIEGNRTEVGVALRFAVRTRRRQCRFPATLLLLLLCLVMRTAHPPGHVDCCALLGPHVCVPIVAKFVQLRAAAVGAAPGVIRSVPQPQVACGGGEEGRQGECGCHPPVAGLEQVGARSWQSDCSTCRSSRANQAQQACL